MNETQISHVFVIESLEPGELHTGKRLSDDLQDHSTIHQHPLVVEYAHIQSKAEFLKLLGRIEVGSRDHGISPIIHLEMHGSNDSAGLVLAESSDNFVAWSELKEPFTRINQFSGLRLVVGLAVCHGAHLFKIVRPKDRAPFWAMLGPKYSIPGQRVHADFTKFYTEWLRTFDGNVALNALNRPEDDEPQYFFPTAEWLFSDVCQRYLRECCTDEAYAERGEELYKTHIHRYGPGVRPRDIAKMLKAQERASIERYRDHFFMLDLYPNNRDRFRITYEHMKEALTRRCS